MKIKHKIKNLGDTIRLKVKVDDMKTYQYYQISSLKSLDCEHEFNQLLNGFIYCRQLKDELNECFTDKIIPDIKKHIPKEVIEITIKAKKDCGKTTCANVIQEALRKFTDAPIKNYDHTGYIGDEVVKDSFESLKGLIEIVIKTENI